MAVVKRSNLSQFPRAKALSIKPSGGYLAVCTSDLSGSAMPSASFAKTKIRNTNNFIDLVKTSMIESALSYLSGGHRLILMGRPVSQDRPSVHIFCWDADTGTLVSQHYNEPMTRYTPLSTVILANQSCVCYGAFSGINYSIHAINGDGQTVGGFAWKGRMAFGCFTQGLSILQNNDGGWFWFNGSEWVPSEAQREPSVGDGYYLWKWDKMSWRPERIGKLAAEASSSSISQMHDVKALLMSQTYVTLISTEGGFERYVITNE